jgi:hypothetical protein
MAEKNIIKTPDEFFKELSVVNPNNFLIRESTIDGSKTEDNINEILKIFVDDYKILNEKQITIIKENEKLKTYILLRKKLSKETNLLLIEKIKQIYTKIEQIKLEISLDKINKATQINEFLTKQELSIDNPETDNEMTKEEIIDYATKLKLSISNLKDNKNAICYVILGTILNSMTTTITELIEKEFFNEDKKGLPDKLSIMTPEQIADTIIQDIKQINGPIFGALMVPNERLIKELGRTPPVIMLLGDVHEGNQQCNSCRDGCYSLYKDNPTFLKYLAKQSKTHDWSIDLFLEAWIDSKYFYNGIFPIWNIIPNRSALTDSKIITTACVGQRKEKLLRGNCFYTEFRTHNANPRQGDVYINNKYHADFIFNFIFTAFNNENSIMDNLLILIKYFNKVYPGYEVLKIFEEIKKLIDATTNIDIIEIFFNSQFFNKFSRTLHEFNKLPKTIQEELKKNLLNAAKNNNTNYIIFNNQQNNYDCSHLFNSIIKILKENKYEEKEKMDEYNLELNKFNFKDTIRTTNDMYDVTLGSALVNIYSISRALKGFKNGLDSQFSVVFQGYHHIFSDILLLENYYDIKKTWGTTWNALEYQQLGYTKINKCILQNDISRLQFLDELDEKYLEFIDINSKELKTITIIYELVNEGKPITITNSLQLAMLTETQERVQILVNTMGHLFYELLGDNITSKEFRDCGLRKIDLLFRFPKFIHSLDNYLYFKIDICLQKIGKIIKLVKDFNNKTLKDLEELNSYRTIIVNNSEYYINKIHILLDEPISQESTASKKKYLKYKNKYLQLKNKLGI